MSTINSIRERCRSGDTVSEIARAEGISRDTVRKYRDADDLSPALPIRQARASKLDAYKSIIDTWMEEDKRTWHKQRHTGKRIWERLRDEHQADVSYTTVQSYVRAKREISLQPHDQYLDLVWAPAEAQADFGEADFYVRGVLTRLFFLTLTFPFSNVGFIQLFRGVTAECVCQGLKDIFAHICGIPIRIVFDNATGIGRRVGEVISTSELFGLFAAHYGFLFSFCNPYAGNEKGAVENMVGAMRRSLFVPRPKIDNMGAYNGRLFDKCRSYCDKDHYLKGESQLQLFVEDAVALGNMPATEFVVVRYEKPKTDKKGRICMEGKHWYSTDPMLGTRHVIAAIGAFDIDIYSEDGAHVATHQRQFGSAVTDVSDPASQLPLLCRKPGAWINSQVRHSVPDELRDYMDNLPKADLKRALITMRDVSATSGYRPTVDAMAYAAKGPGIGDGANITVLAAGIASGRPMIEYEDSTDMQGYDKVFMSLQAGDR